MLIFTFYFFIVIIVIQSFYYLIVFTKFSFYKSQPVTSKKPPISVIVCAKNEEENVQKFIPILLKQDYPNFEVVLIDDASRDETLEVFEEFEKNFKNVKLVKVENNEAFWGNKKFALTLGIKAAKHDNLLFIDADCYPKSTQWIDEVASHFTDDKTIVLGYGAYEKSNSFLNKIIRFETMLTATQYFSWAKFGKPYMGVGRNLAYNRREFFNNNGFVDHIKIRSGDDDLFINQAADAQNTTLCCSPESFTISNPKTSFKEWIKQKRRHVATANYYKKFDKMQLSLFYFSQMAFVLLSVFLVISNYQWIIILSLILFRYLLAWIVLGFSAAKLKEKDVMFWFPVIEITLIFTQFYIFIINIFSKPVHWK
ncbi:MAG: glycosyltransferase [Flavobacterium sp.]|nr:glycosyltransferase [Flavobacterium sp.]